MRNAEFGIRSSRRQEALDPQEGSRRVSLVTSAATSSAPWLRVRMEISADSRPRLRGCSRRRQSAQILALQNRSLTGSDQSAESVESLVTSAATGPVDGYGATSRTQFSLPNPFGRRNP